MLIKLTEIYNNGALTMRQTYTLREVFVNPEHVVMVREESRMTQLNEQGLLPSELDKNHRFSKLIINRGHTGSEIVVVGAPEIIETTLNKNKVKQILKG
jgi:hypothetical protein